MKRAYSRSIAVALVAAGLALLAQPAVARPRSWVLPPLEVGCSAGDGAKVEEFAGEMQLYGAGVIKDRLMVTGSVVGSCGSQSIDSLFRAAVTITDAACDEVTLTLADTAVGGTTINFSEAPLEIEASGPGNLRAALCALAGTTHGTLAAQAKALTRLLKLQA